MKKTMAVVMVIGLVLGVSGAAEAIVYTTVGVGDWSNAATWNAVPPAGGPGVGDEVIVNHNITVDVATTVDKINTGGHRVISLSADLTVSGRVDSGHEVGTTFSTFGNDVSIGGGGKWWGGGLNTRNGAGTFTLPGTLLMVRTYDLQFRPGDLVGNLQGDFVGVNSKMSVTQEVGETTGLTLNGFENNLPITLNFDSATGDAALAGDPSLYDYAFRWLGNQEAALQTLYANGRLIVNSPSAFSSTDNIVYSDPGAGGDGYTYVGFEATVIPEPAGLGLIGLGLLALRRRRS